MKALMSYTSSVLEWLGRSVGLLVFGLLFVTALFIRTTMMTGYFEWAEISSVPWYVYVSGGVILLLTLLWPRILKELTTKQIFIFFSVCDWNAPTAPFVLLPSSRLRKRSQESALPPPTPHGFPGSGEAPSERHETFRHRQKSEVFGAPP